MLRMMCDVQLADGVSTEELIVRLKLDKNISQVVRRESLRWLGYVVKKGDDDFVRKRRGLK